ncbi:hypothetical protein HU230_0007940 [Bradyrhizobium quebecense]|uniref:Uncharacterized protein n=1 Tax=Bradyrhizobium quebecense TaxID=2748629 RepID=A0A973WPC2_9BRAD|nr:hypothetical protein [Bradyrhizobium quebecense]UGA45957.1 hypothetical protein HU230_0007940 [Bradyrhizobium quebecense]
MTDHEIPREGGSYLRQPDGSLKRVHDSAPTATPAPADHKAPASPRSKRSKE